ncbi:hypothetical protein IQ244_29185 [Nostoc sp. LEGE 06077]|uniref:gp53-like domain-containing protein n=1 Tax=Nostoc sp. LEGE 06077 TaxID=915325 RepID=UPI001881F807|nr:hypothetical protein [Nostoc sp. LEGE 06077]MBE9210505.1 hypothetical protein [Nostoc sp. LEGE 06077]
MPLTNPVTTALQKANNLSDLASIASAWANLGADQSLGANSGWIKLPNGLILQWQTYTAASQSFTGGTPYNFNITFPVAFNTVYHCVGSLSNGANNSAVGVHFQALSTTGVTARVNFSITNTTIAAFRVFAIGI